LILTGGEQAADLGEVARRVHWRQGLMQGHEEAGVVQDDGFLQGLPIDQGAEFPVAADERLLPGLRRLRTDEAALGRGPRLRGRAERAE
jgi:hypothetical protein